MKRLIAVTVLVTVLLMPAAAFAHHVGMAEDYMPADQWIYVDSVAHGASADGMGTETDLAPGDEMGADVMAGYRNLEVTGNANMWPEPELP